MLLFYSSALDSKGRFAVLFIISSLFLAGGISQVMAVPTPVTFDDTGSCDPLVVPTLVDELGIAPPFPMYEVIITADIGPGPVVCPSTDLGNFDSVVAITNANPIPFTDVWYVADQDTVFTNIDGVVVGPGGPGNAFKIDANYCDPVGINLPLLSESMNADCVFEPGETWEFVIQDYFSPLFLPSAIASIGVTSPEATPDFSSGSIIAIPGKIPTVGGEMINVDSTALILAGTQNTAAWMIPVIVSVIGIGIVISRKF